jgi:hypothetical protein
MQIGEYTSRKRIQAQREIPSGSKPSFNESEMILNS